MNDIAGFDLDSSRVYLKIAIVNSLLGVCLLLGIFFYLNRHAKRRYFRFWLVAWLFHALWLALCLGTRTAQEHPASIMLKQWCVGASVVFLLWGSAGFLKLRARSTELALFLAFLWIWNYLGVYQFDSLFQMQLPVFALVGMACLVIGWCFYRFRAAQPFLGAGLLASGFGLWGAYIAAYPFLQRSDRLIIAGYMVSAVLQLFLAASMIILLLEEVRQSNLLVSQELRSYKTKTEVLQKQVLSTEERYRSLFDQASEGIVIADARDLRILELNQTAKRMLGIEEAGSQTLSSFCRLPTEAQSAPPRTGPEWFDAICSQRMLRLVRRDGQITATEPDGARIDFEGRAAFQFFLRERTERARLEQQLREAEKLAALGQMISGVAHELNNPLAAIKGYVELVLRRDELGNQTRTDLGKVANESNRAAKLVSNFVSFARKQPMHREKVNMNAMVRHVTQSRKAELQKAGVELCLNLDPHLPATQADPDQLQQVLMNLVNNALHALAEVERSGRLLISTRHREAVIFTTVEDNGPGVAPEVLPYIFEPFFTTREVGVGTGLGLSIAHSIMMDHDGRVSHQSLAPTGACFVLELPVVGPQVQPQATAVPDALPFQTARILVLDDDQAIGELLGEMLTLLGYSAKLCNSAPEAVKLVGQHEFDLIISDFRMPKMNGQEFYREAIGIKPELARRVIFLTGDVVNEETQAFLQSTGNPHLSKPFQLARVEEAIAQVLRQQPASGGSHQHRDVPGGNNNPGPQTRNFC